MASIKLEGLKKSYGRGDKKLEVLRGIDLELNAGDTVAVLGSSGAGKSTLLNIIGALDRPTEGSVSVDGNPIFSFDEKKLAEFRNSTVGFVFQFHHLLPEFTAVENVMLPSMIAGVEISEAKAAAEELLVSVGLRDRLTHKPGELSGGEQQRCAIVRALIRKPKVILADEPTGNLDKKTGLEVFDLLLELNKKENITLIVVTHNESLAERLSRRIEMVDGRIVEEKSSPGI